MLYKGLQPAALSGRPPEVADKASAGQGTLLPRRKKKKMLMLMLMLMVMVTVRRTMIIIIMIMIMIMMVVVVVVSFSFYAQLGSPSHASDCCCQDDYRPGCHLTARTRVYAQTKTKSRHRPAGPGSSMATPRTNVNAAWARAVVWTKAEKCRPSSSIASTVEWWCIGDVLKRRTPPSSTLGKQETSSAQQETLLGFQCS